MIPISKSVTRTLMTRQLFGFLGSSTQDRIMAAPVQPRWAF